MRSVRPRLVSLALALSFVGPVAWLSPKAAEASVSFAVTYDDMVTDADLVVVAFGTAGKYIRYAVAKLREQGHRVGYVRPITLFPFPSEAVRRASANARQVAVYENNMGQMIDDVRLALEGRVPVRFIGGLSLDSSGFGIAPDFDVEVLSRRIEGVLQDMGGAR